VASREHLPRRNPTADRRRPDVADVGGRTSMLAGL
jgi:hypothetical protein